MKHLELVIVTLVLRIPLYTSQDVATFFIITKNHCITNDESAIAFNPDINKVNENENTLSRLYPTTNYNRSDYNCNIEKGEPCTDDYIHTNWSLQNSITGDINEEITDRRWEEFKLRKSSYVLQNGLTLAYTEAPFSITKGDFVIPLSLRLKNEGHIFLCEGSVTNSNCYWIMLQAWNGNTSAIRRCNAGGIPQWKWPLGSCKMRRADFNHTEDIISDKFWTHLKIIKKGDDIAVKIHDHELLTFKDDQPFSPRHVFFHSKNNVGLWKFHQYTYLYTNQEGYSQLGPKFQFRKGFNCLAFFAVMCKRCELHININFTNENYPVYNGTIVTWNQKWKEFKITFHLPNDQPGTIYTTTYQRGFPFTKMFWAIDSITQCENNEYRVLQFSLNDVPCQLVASNDVIVAVDKNEVVSNPNTNCSENTFGKNCLPCDILGQHFCPSLKYCELIDNKTSCYCTAGFHTETCSIRCSEKYYGHGCKKQCKHCLRGCNNIDGSCIDGLCSKDFLGKTCDKRPDLPYDMVVTWTDKNDMNVFWKYPNDSDEQIIEFFVNITSEKSIKLLKKNRFKKNYNLTYAYMIERKYFEPCKKYSITLYNGKYSTLFYARTEVWSPPLAPDISEYVIGINHTNTVTLFSIPKLTYPENGLENCSRNLHIFSSKDNGNVNEDIQAIEKALKESLRFPFLHDVIYMYNINQEHLPFEFPVTTDTTMKYRLHLFFVNTCFGMVRLNTIQKELFPIKSTTFVDSTRIAIYSLLSLAILLLVIPFVLICRFIWKHSFKKRLLRYKGHENERENEIPLRDFTSTQPSTSQRGY